MNGCVRENVISRTAGEPRWAEERKLIINRFHHLHPFIWCTMGMIDMYMMASGIWGKWMTHTTEVAALYKVRVCDGA